MLLQSVLRHWPIGRKFALIGLVSLVMTAVPGACLVTRLVDDAREARQEQAAIAPADVALQLLRLTQQHRGLAAVWLAGDASVGDKAVAKRGETEGVLARLRRTAVVLGSPALDQRIEAVDREWRALARAVQDRAVTAPESYRRHTDLIGQQLALLDSMADVSGIALDPHGDTHHLAQMVLLALPRLTERMGQARARGAALLGHLDQATELERATLRALNDDARLQAQEAQRRMQKLGTFDAAMLQALEGPARAAAAAAEQNQALVVRAAAAQDTTLSSAAYFAAATGQIDAQFEFVSAAFGQLATALQQRQAAAQRELAGITLALLVLAAVGGVILWAIARATTRSLGRSVQVARAVADGDLACDNIDVTGRDEAGRLLEALKDMNARLATVVGRVRQNSDSVATASEQIAHGNADLSSRTESQASALQQTAATMEQLGSAVQQNAANAQRADTLAQGASAVAARGGEVVSRVVATMQGIHDSSGRIAEIIGVIDGISFQTNLLALNAAVEAARAGEHGRGFAVVASEVRALAQRSAEAAREVRSLINASVEQVQRGSALADQAGATMDEVVAVVADVTRLIGEISAASAEQSHGVAEVAAAVGQMDLATQQNAALVEESAAAAMSLRQQAREMVETVAVFRLG